MSTIGRGAKSVKDQIERAAEAAGRDPASIRLVAVSKFHPAEAIREAFDTGLRDFGENYVQHMVAKQEELSDLAGQIRWHFIGHLQRNKARHVVGKVDLVQTVDSGRLLREIGKRAPEGAPAAVLIQVNAAGEESKSGVSPEELGPLLAEARAQEGVVVRGLMAIPPWEAEPEEARTHFVALRQLRDEHGGAAVLPELSMGMSGDFDVAIAEGATIVRVGTAIFGPRPT